MGVLQLSATMSIYVKRIKVSDSLFWLSLIIRKSQPSSLKLRFSTQAASHYVILPGLFTRGIDEAGAKLAQNLLVSSV